MISMSLACRVFDQAPVSILASRGTSSSSGIPTHSRQPIIAILYTGISSCRGRPTGVLECVG